MSNIIIINGPCWIGKSTISQALHLQMLWSFIWKKDEQRRNISWYKSSKESYKESAQSILTLTQFIIHWSIINNNDLIFDWFLRRVEDIESLKATTIENWGWFYHFILNAPRDFWQTRIHKRWVWWSLTFEKAEYFYNEIKKLESLSPHISIDVSNKSIDWVVLEILEKLKKQHPPS